MDCTALTDSKPCVQAIAKLCRGEFSSSPRISTFLSGLSRYNVALLHLAGASNVPADFASRTATACTDDGCHMCKFVSEKQQSVVVRAAASVSKVPDAGSLYTSHAGWLATQAECGHLRWVRPAESRYGLGVLGLTTKK